MTIRRGEQWGQVVERPDDLVVVGSDADLADRLGRVTDLRPLAVRGGDLSRTLGRGSADASTVMRVPVDRLAVALDGVAHLAVANVVARRSWWRGRIVVACNAEYLGRWDIAPRAHPNDGLLEVLEVDADMSLRARFQACRRLPSGAHLPHPDIAVRRAASASWRFDPPLDVWVDGRRHRRVADLQVTVEPDAFELHI